MPRIGPTELIIILFIVLVIFGAGRLPSIGSALGKGILSFKKGISGEEEEKAPSGRKAKGKKTK